MFLTSDYILANELVHKMGIDLANICMLRKQYVDGDDLYNIRKLNNCLFVNAKTKKLPKNIKKGIASFEFTDVSNLLPCTYVRGNFNVTEEELVDSGIVLGETKIMNKRFYVFNRDFADTVKQQVPYILNKEETTKCRIDGTINGYIQLSKNKFFTWY